MPMASISKISFLLTFLATILLSPPLISAQNSNHFSEYIGAQFTGVKFSDVPVNPNVDFHFILGFAIDYTATPTPTNGQFNVFWQSDVLTPAAVASIKQANPNVKVAVSIGGDTVNNSPASFNPTSTDTWVANAVSSLTALIQQYNLDGIDIDYEHFTGDAATFTDCIGQLITTLKNNGVISFASIAPYDDPQVQSYYQALWAQYSDVIDYVNFQFYAYAASTTESQFLSYFDTQTSTYGGKVLASFTSASSGGGGLSPANGFFDACNTLKSQGKLPGIFVFSADDSKSEGFEYEIQAQALLASA
uniref:Class V chitinase n=1 Tax=Lilium regale TaxID=82328 RepID=A0A1Y0B6N1_LILRE|nr:class V chitinase [Lilium regale]